MHLDVTELRDFYGRPLGRVARRLIGRRIHAIWPDVTGCSVLGIGYATPYLRPFLASAERVAAIMPAAQGVITWPKEGPYRTCLADTTALPLPDECMDRVLVVHALETADSLRQTLRQIWRVTKVDGRILLVVPNRRSLWARVESTPFGHGTPYSRSQIARVLRDNLMAPERVETTLFLPPVQWRFNLRAAGAFEVAGDRLWPQFAGVLVVEAKKQVYAEPIQTGRRFRLPQRVPAIARPALTSATDTRSRNRSRSHLIRREKRNSKDEDGCCRH